jgi:hypothetical protein
VDNYYQILGVPKTATQAQIQAKYHTLAKEHDPSRFMGMKNKHQATGDPDLLKVIEEKILQEEETLKCLNEAYETLSDPKKKKEYDEKLFSPKPPVTKTTVSSTPAKAVVNTPIIGRRMIYAILGIIVVVILLNLFSSPKGSGFSPIAPQFVSTATKAKPTIDPTPEIYHALALEDLGQPSSGSCPMDKNAVCEFRKFQIRNTGSKIYHITKADICWRGTGNLGVDVQLPPVEILKLTCVVHKRKAGTAIEWDKLQPFIEVETSSVLVRLYLSNTESAQ